MDIHATVMATARVIVVLGLAIPSKETGILFATEVMCVNLDDVSLESVPLKVHYLMVISALLTATARAIVVEGSARRSKETVTLFATETTCAHRDDA